MDFNRSFSAGSRQAPDPHDQYLERENYYRKHTPRDASSLFRCISEQLFDTQNYYRRVRDECCAYMRRNRNYFESHVDGDFEEYMQNMQHFRTRGTLLELRALAYRYRRNVILFEPFTLGNSFIQQPQFGNSLAFLVFVAPDYHFDTVYTREEIEDAAFSQSLVYETLYKDVFQLPDVAYSVERMLHDQLGTRLTAIEGLRADDEDCAESEASDTDSDEESLSLVHIGAVTEDGREFLFDTRTGTKCILEDYRMCHFHNEAFAEYLDSLRAIGDGNNHGGGTNNTADRFNRRREDSMLKASDVSCVRQLLNAGITPFPYKVAKALDPNIYRNIEFDVWSELRKLARSRYLYKRFISVGDKCFIRLNDEKEAIPVVGATTTAPQAIDCHGATRNNKQMMAIRAGGDNDDNNKRVATSGTGKVYVGHVQHIEKYTNLYHVYVEELRERLVVHYNTLRPCPNGNNTNSRDFTAIGLNGSGRVFNRIRDQQDKYPRQGYYSPSSAAVPHSANHLPHAAKQFMRNNNTYGRNMGGFYRQSYHQYQQHHQYAYQRNNKRFAHNNQNNISDDEDLTLAKKRAAIMDTSDPYRGELDEKKYEVEGIYQESQQQQRFNIKELLCSTYYYAESAKYFQCQDIIAMPAFITSNKNPVGPDPNKSNEQRQNQENLKRNQNNSADNPDKNGNNGDYDPFNSNTNNESESQSPGVPVMEDPAQTITNIEDQQLQPPHHQLPYEQYHVSEPLSTHIDPNSAIYTTTGSGQQFYTSAATGIGGAQGATYYMPANAMDLTSAYYNPMYRNGAVSQGAAVSSPYYCNYVYSNATGSMQTVTPYVVANGSAGAMAVPGQFDGQLIPIQTAIGRRDLLCSDTPINVNAGLSYSAKGNDMPMNDMGSLRFYYNLGVQCFGYLASIQGSQNALNALQYGDSRQPMATEEGGDILGQGTPPIVSAVVQSPAYLSAAGGNLNEVGLDLKAMSIEGTGGGTGNNRNDSTTSAEINPTITAPGAQPTRNSTPSSTVAQGECTSTSGATSTTTTTSSAASSTGNNSNSNSAPGRNFQGPGYRRPPFNNNNSNLNNNRGGGYGGGGGRNSYSNNNYRGGMQPQQQQQHHQHQGYIGGDSKGKDSNNRGPGTNYHYNNYGYAYSRRNGPNGGAGRFNNNSYGNHMNHRKPLNSTGSSSADGNRTTANNSNINTEDKVQSPFPVTTGSNSANVPHAAARHGPSQSPATKVVYNDSGASVAHSGGQVQYVGQHHPHPVHGSEEVLGNNNNAVYGNQEGIAAAQNQLQSSGMAMNYFGATGGQQFAFSGPPPHLPPPFGNTNLASQVITSQPQQQQMISLPPMTSLPQQLPQQQVYNSPFYTYATYYPVDGSMVMGQGGMMSAAAATAAGGDGTVMTANGSANMIIQQMPYMAPTTPASPYNGAPQNQHLMSTAAGFQQISTPPNQQPVYYTSIAGAEPGTPIMQSPAAGQLGSQPAISWANASMQEGTIPWSSTTGGTPGNSGNSGPSSGIGSTESSPPYASGTGVGHGGGHATQVYANQSPAYNYSYPPPSHQQQQVWYAHPPVVGPSGSAGGGGGGGGSAGVAPGTPVPVKADGKP